MNKEGKEVREEIRREFQLERMILFSDAVFAIAITLMAIDIRLPDLHKTLTPDEFYDQLLWLVPSIITYAGSFSFIGYLWYEHLQIFSILKDYDRGLVTRNLIMLFFVGLFPFGASIVVKVNNGLFLPAIIYFFVIFGCQGAQLQLRHYILIRRPHLRINAGVHEEILKFKKYRLAIYTMVCVFILVMITYGLIRNPLLRYFAWWWFMPFPFILKYFQKRIK